MNLSWLAQFKGLRFSHSIVGHHPGHQCSVNSTCKARAIGALNVADLRMTMQQGMIAGSRRWPTVLTIFQAHRLLHPWRRRVRHRYHLQFRLQLQFQGEKGALPAEGAMGSPLRTHASLSHVVRARMGRTASFHTPSAPTYHVNGPKGGMRGKCISRTSES